jgi:hypothetical protein
VLLPDCQACVDAISEGIAIGVNWRFVFSGVSARVDLYFFFSQHDWELGLPELETCNYYCILPDSCEATTVFRRAEISLISKSRLWLFSDLRSWSIAMRAGRYWEMDWLASDSPSNVDCPLYRIDVRAK